MGKSDLEKIEDAGKHISEQFQCKEWFRLVIESLKFIDSREKRLAVLRHPYECNHPNCKVVAKTMREVIGK